eukprot:2979050-Alexandrium_andersonii.AAC.1
MSASLVGSEMCIRDRFAVHATPILGSLLFKQLRGGASGALSAPVKPVSYTHLTLPTICSV